MGLSDLSCPVCHADVPMAGDERPGDPVYCTYCGAPCLVAGPEEEPDGWELEEDY